MKQFKSFFKTVGGNEGGKCHYPTSLDTYGCGCAHNCAYCYAKSLLDFRKLWNPAEPAVANVKDIEKTVAAFARKNPGKVVRLGGMTDCFQPCELKWKASLATIKILNCYRVPYLIVTKSGIIGYDEYIEVLDPRLAHIQVSITTTDPKVSASIETATLPEGRMWAVSRLYDEGLDVAIRLSPFLPGMIDLEKIAKVRCDKMILEFLRVNGWIEKWLGPHVDLTPYTVKHGGYRHMPLAQKIGWANRIKEETGKTVSVCEDEDDAYQYWRENFNPNENDCCNLRLGPAR